MRSGVFDHLAQAEIRRRNWSAFTGTSNGTAYGRDPNWGRRAYEAESIRGTVAIVDEGDGEYRPTAGMLQLLRALLENGKRVVDSGDLHACRRRGLIGLSGQVTEAGRDLLDRYDGRELPRG